jgi:xanthine dehydrogenase accessory factor
VVSEVIEAVARLVEEDGFGSRATLVAGPDFGSSALLVDSQVAAGIIPTEIEKAVAADAAELLRRERSLTLTYGLRQVYIESIVPRPHLVIFGAVHIAQELSAIAPRLGFVVTVSDARAAFTTRDRFPEADRLLVGWPDQVEVTFDRRTYVVVLSHDARFEDPLWPRVLPSPAVYIGAMGSTRTAQRRRQDLFVRGFSEDQIGRIHGPIGLMIGAESPGEVAVAILGEIIATRYRVNEPMKLQGVVEAI